MSERTALTIKQKMIEAARDAYERDYEYGIDWEDTGKVIDAALAVMADPANWTPEMAEIMDIAAYKGEWQDVFSVVINHIRESKA